MNRNTIVAVLVAGLLIPAQPAWADCPEIDIPYAAADIAYAQRARAMVATALVAPPAGWQIYSNPKSSTNPPSFSYCEFEKRPKVIPPVPIVAQATYRRTSEAHGYIVYIIANNSKEGTASPWLKSTNHLYKTWTYGTINPAQKSKLAGFTIVYEVRKDMSWAMSEADLADLEQMVDKARLQQLIDEPLPDAEEAKAQLAAHNRALDEKPATPAKPAKATSTSTPGQPAESAKPKKPAKPKLRLPGGLPRIPSF